MTNRAKSGSPPSLLAVLVVLWAATATAEVRVERDVVYGVLSGLSLTMDVYRPSDSIRRGIVLIPGSAWDGRETGYTDWQVKAGDPYINRLRDELVRAGFTIFAVNHRMAPVHRYPAAVADVRRAVRFIRHNAAAYNIEKDALAAVGHSSGGHLAAMLGVLDDTHSDQSNSSGVENESSRVQAVVAIGAPFDLSIATPLIMPFTVAFLGEPPPMDATWSNVLRKGVYADASPITHVTQDDSAFLLIHGVGDPNVSELHMKLMAEALEKANVSVTAMPIPEPSHTPKLDYSLIADWLNHHLE
jgi:acetyl esterase/lipase